MRNLKKILAVICVVAMLASVAIVPALAATSFDTQATTLNNLGIMQGTGLTDPSNRLQGLIFAIRAAGKEKAALAMSDADVAAALANVVDAKDIPAWGQKYAAYAVANALTKGVGGVTAPQIKFAPLAPIHGTEFLVWLLKIGMGYTTDTNTILSDAVTAGVVTVSQAITFGSKELIRDDVAGMLWGAVSNGKMADGKTKFIDALIANGAVTQDAAVAAGLFTVAPTKLAVSSVTAITLTRVVVTFNKPVDKDSIGDGDFAVDGTDILADNVSLSDDKTVATLKILDDLGDPAPLSNGDEIDIEVSGLTDASGAAMTDYESTFTPNDSQQPTVKSIEFTGPETAKLTMSEPISEDNSDAAEVIIDGGIYSAAPADGYDDSAEITINLGTELDEGAHTFKVKGFEDFAGYSNLVSTLNVSYAAVTSPITATVKEATQSYVILKFNRPVSDLATEDFYQSYSSWQPLELQNGDGDAAPDATTDTVRLVFTVAETLAPADAAWDDAIDRPLPVGTVKVVVKDEGVTDNWDNKNDGDIVLSATVTADTTKPTITKVTVEAENQLHVYFSKDVKTADAEDDGNYVIKNSKGTVVSSTKWNAENYNTDDKYVEINFNDNLDNGDYTIKAEGISDTTISANTLDTVTLPFTITDKSTSLDDTDVTWVEASHVLYVKYTDAMATTGTGSVLDKANYRLDGDTLGDSVKLTMFNSKIVKMQFPSDQDDPTGLTLTIGHVKDAAGNEVGALATDKTIAAEAAPVVTAIKKIAANKFELTIDQELKSISAGAIQVDKDGEAGDDFAPANASYKFVNDGDATKITVTVPDAQKDDTTVALADNIYEIIINDSATSKITSITGMVMDGITYVAGAAANGFDDYDNSNNFTDGVAPKIATDAVTDDKVVNTYDLDSDGYIDHIIIGYSEDIKADTVSKYTYTVDGYKVLSAATDSSAVGGGDITDVLDSLGASDSAAGDGVDGAFVVLVLDEGDDYDTDSTPGVTQALDIEDLSDNVLAKDADSFDSFDYAAPVLVGVDATVGSDAATLTFSEKVWGGTAADPAAIELDDFVYTDGNAAGATDLDAVDDTTDFVNKIDVTFDADVVAGDLIDDDVAVDTINVAADSIYDKAGNVADETVLTGLN